MSFPRAALAAIIPRLPMGWVCLLLGSIALSPAAFAVDDPTAKEMMGRAQTQSDTKAVEDLIGKLQARKSPTAPAGPAPSASPPPAAMPPAATETREPPPDASPQAAAPTPAPAAPSSGTTATETAGGASPEETVKSAEAKALPSVDLEVYFAYDSSRIAPAAVAVLTTLGKALSDERLAKDFFLIAGHTDAKGGAAYNLRLSQARADSVRRYLMDNFGIDGKRLVARGFGLKHLKDPGRPLADVNRRVQIINYSTREGR
ncbi:MAG: OmpA family protein [Hyphomicrobiaceae bacterium]|nr:MAG: OmpA family protein [Hyphomicrobiaceae bacterium]